MRWTRLILVVIILAGAAYGVSWWRGRPAGAAVAYEEARSAPLVTEWSATGYVESRTANVGAPLIARVSEIAVEEGDRVVAGQLLARLTDAMEQAAVDVQREGVRVASAQTSASEAAVAEQETLLASAISRAEAEVTVARERVSQTEAGRDRAREVVQANLDAARAEDTAARARVRDLESGARAQEVAQAEADVAAASATSERATQELRRQQMLLESGAVARRAVDDARESSVRSDAVLRARRAALDLLRAGTRPEQIAEARAAAEAAAQRIAAAQAEIRGLAVEDRRVAEARAALNVAEAAGREVRAGRARIDTLQAQARASGAQIGQGQASVRQAQATLGERVVVAPFAGVIGRRYVDPGDVAVPQQPLFSVVAGERAWVAAEVDEQDLAPVRIGQSVRITTPAYPGRVFLGAVESIGAEAIPQTQVRTGARIVRVRVSLHDTPAEDRPLLKPGMEVHVAGDTELASEAVLAPNDAVLQDAQGAYVFVVEGAADARVVRQRRITAGYIAGRETEIVTGLRPGEWVVISGKEGLADRDAVRVKEPPVGGSP